MMQEAGFLTFFRTIGIILLVVYSLKFFTKYLVPFLLKTAINRAQKKAAQRSSNFENDNTDRKAGETTIDKKPSNRNLSKMDGAGDYVDFEEID